MGILRWRVWGRLQGDYAEYVLQCLLLSTISDHIFLAAIFYVIRLNIMLKLSTLFGHGHYCQYSMWFSLCSTRHDIMYPDLAFLFLSYPHRTTSACFLLLSYSYSWVFTIPVLNRIFLYHTHTYTRTYFCGLYYVSH